MRIFSLVILIILMSVFAIGVSLQETDWGLIEESLNNVTVVITNMTLEHSSSNEHVNSIILIIEKFIHFVGVLLIECMRIGVRFGYENPQYLELLFILNIIKLIIWLVIIDLLIKPVSYLIVLIILFIMWIREKIDKKRRKRLSKNE